jgi:hypothetical protein
MNERIKELAEKAGFVLWGEETWNPGDAIDWSSRYDDELTKLIELVVKECIGVVEGGQFIHDQAPTALFAKECSGAIKKHFGVKE